MYVRLVGAFCVAGLFLAPLTALGQDKFEDLGVFRDTLRMDVPQPFILRPFIREDTEAVYAGGERLDSTAYRIDYRHGRLWVTASDADTVIVSYRTWGFGFRDIYRHPVTRIVEGESESVAEVSLQERSPGLFSGSQLQRSGSITRGILAGNNRDATIESGLRLQMQGQVTEGVRVRAVLTDESTPILPEGTTQRLNEFDRVFIEIDTDRGMAQLGDFDARYDGSAFARFERKVQGVGVSASLPLGVNVTMTGATARGIYRRQSIDVIDGVQGPYRLTGENNERFIFVVPGSEIVFIDEQRATRGQVNDYVIDYATGEITFTSSRLMREDNRVRVEFQYRTTEFTRTLLGANTDILLKRRQDGSARARLGATFLREADARTFSQEFGLTDEDQMLLEMLGDSTALRSGVVQVPYEAEAPFVQYVQRDTLVGGSMTLFYEAVRTTPVGPVYRIHFSHVGEGKGAYVREGRTANGILYVYRGPGLGAYDPVRLLPRPRQQRMLDLRGSIEPIRGLEIFGEWAQSVNDENRFSRLDEEDDKAHAWTGGVRIGPQAFQVGGSDLGMLSGFARRRFTGDHFAAFSSIHPIEFERRWNLDSRTLPQSSSRVQGGTEVINEANLEWAFTEATRIKIDAGRIRRTDAFRGDLQEYTLELGETNLPRIFLYRTAIRSEDTIHREDGSWLRQRGRVEQPFFRSRLTARFEVEQEQRRQHAMGTDSLGAASIAFVEYRPGLTFKTEKAEVGTILEVRTEDLWAEGVLRNGSRSVTLETNFDTHPVQSFRMEGRVGLRQRTYSDFFRTERQLQDRQSVVMRWSGRWQPWKRSVVLDWFYEALTERTPTLQEIYIRTGPELGEYVWEDTNGDGVLQIDEFLPERTQDEGAYVRTLIPSDSLQSVIGVQTNITVQLDPARSWRTSPTNWKRFLSNVYTRTSVQIQEKSRNPDLSQIYLLQLGAFRSPVYTLKGRLRVQQDVFLFRSQPGYGLNLSFHEVHSLSELAAGTETRFVRQWKADGHVRLSGTWGIRMATSIERTKTDSETFTSRTFDIRSTTFSPEIVSNPTQDLQFTGSLVYSQKSVRTSATRAQIWKVPFTGQYTLARRLNITGRAEMASVLVDNEERSVGLARFALTDGRGIGTSFLWTLSTGYQINRTLRATASYNGRSPADAPVIHTLRISMNAVF